MLECKEKLENTKKHTGMGEFESSAGAVAVGGATYTSTDKGPITLKKEAKEAEPLLQCNGKHIVRARAHLRHGRERIIFTGCTHDTKPCETDPFIRQDEGTIESEPLDNYISKTYVENEEEKEAGEYLEVIEGRELEKVQQNQSKIGPFMKFKCGETVYEVTGAVEGPLQGFTTDTMMPTLAATFAEGNSGVQDLSVSENSEKPVHVILSAAPTMTYPGEMEFGVVPSHPGAEIVNLLQKKTSEKKYLAKEVTIKAGETVQYQVVVYNISTFNRTFSPLKFTGCEGIKPSGETEIKAGKSEVFECTRKFSETGESIATISGDLGFGTKGNRRGAGRASVALNDGASGTRSERGLRTATVALARHGAHGTGGR